MHEILQVIVPAPENMYQFVESMVRLTATSVLSDARKFHFYSMYFVNSIYIEQQHPLGQFREGLNVTSLSQIYLKNDFKENKSL